MSGEVTEPPYRRIAADIRRRVVEGELSPGDRVPSTRRLAEQWGVALATATRALMELRLEGYVETRPRVGTVVAPHRPASRPVQRPQPPPEPQPHHNPRPRHAANRTAATPSPRPVERATPEDPDPDPNPDTDPDAELTRERVVRAAIEIADTEGLAALSMRGVAARLGVAAMSPYRHVGGKAQLVSLMADTAYGECGYPATPPPGWRARLELGARTLWRLHRRHPWLAHLSPLGRPPLLPNLLAHGEWLLGALEGHGLDVVTMMDIHVLVFAHVQGMAVTLEREAQAQAATGRTDDEWMATQQPTLSALAASGRYPAFSRTLGGLRDGDYDLDLDALFEFGLTALLDGLTPLVERTGLR
ncbi:TetR/AcrR family transcriptional regulator C-terminal domain-containing protein [Streptomyces fradiae]|uniref:TetR/AcrR family transcriptional regulator C-terminal domain-containing protein n=1 Tax=Streptomyces fradiae TaxID=1906 RepID=UPI0037BDFC7F